jgi:hypothetical protein
MRFNVENEHELQIKQMKCEPDSIL